MGVKISKVCPVDIDGIFKFENYVFQISTEDPRYKVDNKAIIVDGKVINDYTDECAMDVVKVILQENEDIMFMDEYQNIIDSSLITFIREED